jgi:hypothetical protein
MLPFCQPEEGKRYVLEDLGEVLEGDRLVSTPYEIKFLVDAQDQELCTKHLGTKDLENLRNAIADDYYFQVGGWAGGGWRGRQAGAGGVAAEGRRRQRQAEGWSRGWGHDSGRSGGGAGWGGRPPR